MPGYVKLERWKVVEYRDGATYKTKRVGYMWFPINEQPECYVVDAETPFVGSRERVLLW